MSTYRPVVALGLLLLPLSSLGQLSRAWIQRYSANVSGGGGFSHIRTDEAGNVYAAGGVELNNGTHVVLCKYSTSAGLLWQATFPMIGANYTQFAGLEIDSDRGVAYVSAVSDRRMATVAFSMTTGSRQATAYYDPGPFADAYPRGLLLDPGNAVYVFGQRSLPQDGGREAVVIKYSLSLTGTWLKAYRLYALPKVGSEYIAGVLDSDGNIVLAGYSDVDTDDTDVLVQKFASNGAHLWTRHFGSGVRTREYGSLIAEDGAGEYLVVGDLGPMNSGMAKFSKAGERKWMKGMDPTLPTFANDVEVQGTSFILAGGQNENGSVQPWAGLFDAQGVPVWSHVYAQNVSGHGRFEDVSFGSAGDVHLTGYRASVALHVKLGSTTGGLLDDYRGFTQGQGITHALDPFGNIYMGSSEYTNASLPTLTKLYQTPVLVDDSYSASENTILHVPQSRGLLANDRNVQNAGATLVSAPASGTVSLNASGSFSYTPAANFVGTVTFSYKATRSAQSSNVANVTITVKHGLRSAAIGTSPLTGGNATRLTFSLTGSATGSGDTVTVSADSPAISVPSSVNVPAGANSGSLIVQTSPVATATTAAVTLELNGSTVAAQLNVLPPALSALTLNPNAVQGGKSTAATVTLNGRSPEGGTEVGITDNSGAITTPPSVTVLAGNRSVVFTVTTSPVTATATRTVSASRAGVVRTASLTISP